ncbi:MAG: PIN domain-containing protein [Fibrobacteres bacterium]|nr:PIN domain-containing protein [Fibrobacterota bacterium]
MAKKLHLDTHAVVWLFAGEIDRFPHKTRRLLESGILIVSPAIQLELQFLFEINRIIHNGSEILQTLQKDIGLTVSETEYSKVVSEAVKMSWTRDPFDRLITAHASLEHAQLITKDDHIHKHFKNAVWS